MGSRRTVSKDVPTPTIEAFFLADRAEVVNNKLYVMGGFIRNVWSQQFPMQANFSIVLIVGVPPVMAGRSFDWTIMMQDSLGNAVGTLGGKSTANRPAQSDESEPIHSLIVIPGFALGAAMPGNIRFSATVGASTARLNLFVTRTAR